MLYTDKIFVDRVAFNLDGFKWLREGLANFRCNICGDSQKRKRIKRAYFYIAKDSSTYRFCCKNCSADMKFSFYLRKHFPSIAQEYRMAKYRSGPQTSQTKPVEKAKNNIVIELEEQSIAELPQAHPAVVYLQGRKVPRKHFNRIFYSKDSRQTCVELEVSEEYASRVHQAEALIFPMHDADKKIGGLIFRYFEGAFRYQMVMLNEDFKKVYGLDRFNRNHPAFIVEGPIDSLFLPNCLAACGADLRQMERHFDKSKTILVYDNEPRSKEIVKRIEKSIADGFIVYIPPATFDGIKDINDLVSAMVSTKDIIFTLVSNSYSGLKAKMALQGWKKC